MIENIFEHYLSKQKKLWLERKSKGKDPTPELLGEAESRYEKSTWLNKAIKQARHAITTHASTFTHPDAKSSCFKFSNPSVKNGFLSTNNVTCKNNFDLFGNAATDSFVKEIYLFLIESVDEITIWEHLNNESNEIKQFIQSYNLDFNEVKISLSKLMIDPEPPKTHKLLKQVYFPVDDNYHLLSLLTPSVVTSELLDRLNLIRFSERTKQARSLKKDNKFSEYDYQDIFDLTEVAFGGSKPQNVSVLNSQNAGRAYLLSSCPPILEKRAIRLPRTDFFAQCLYRKNYQDSFVQLHKFMQLDLNNIDIRTVIQNILKFVIDQIILQGLKIRESYPEGWSQQEYYASLPKLQRIWLDSMYAEQRENEKEWCIELSEDIARWILRSYENVINDAYMLGTGEINHVKQHVEESLRQAKEFF